ncbi:uncharacterized protein LOC118752489 [Rhagoletis pomonella]|nr:uncharacterized protein LOC118752489 [Rhagoletis pomonella]
MSTIPSGNRYSILAEGMLNSPKAKRKKATAKAHFPALPDVSTNNNSTDPKFIIIKSTDASKPLSSFSVFAKKKALDCISTEYLSVSILRDDSLLILAKSLKVAEKFIKCKNFGGLCPISANFHDSLNTCKGTIFDKNLAHTDEQEILEALKPQGVVAIYKFTKTVDNVKIPTGRIVLSFNLYKVPQSIDIAWYSVRVEEYFPNPMRCRSCQLLGHTMKRCSNNSTCERCNFPPHNDLPCLRTMCANCYGPHPASAKDCPKYLQEKEVLKIKTQNKCNYPEARRLYKIQNPINVNQDQTYASILNSTQAAQHSLSQNPTDLTSSVGNSTGIPKPHISSIQSHSYQPNESLSSAHSHSVKSLTHVHTSAAANTQSTQQSLPTNSFTQLTTTPAANWSSISQVHPQNSPPEHSLDSNKNNSNEINTSLTHNASSTHTSNDYSTSLTSYNSNFESTTQPDSILHSLLNTISGTHNDDMDNDLQEPTL